MSDGSIALGAAVLHQSLIQQQIMLSAAKPNPAQQPQAAQPAAKGEAGPATAPVSSSRRLLDVIG